MKNKITTKAFFVFITLFALSISNINISHAQVGDPDSNNSSCVTLDNNMRYRMRDTQVNNEVSDLQDYLIAEGYLSGSITGYFGVATLKAVKSFQSNNGLLASGYVGPITRVKIKSLSCDVASTNPGIPTPPVVITPPVLKPGIMCTMEARLCPDGTSMYRDANCVWHEEMCKGESANAKPSFKLMPLSDGKPLIAGQTYNVCWQKSSSDLKDSLIYINLVPYTIKKGDGGIQLSTTYLSQGCTNITIPAQTVEGQYVVSANNADNSLYSNSPTFQVTNNSPVSIKILNVLGNEMTNNKPLTIADITVGNNDLDNYRYNSLMLGKVNITKGKYQSIQVRHSCGTVTDSNGALASNYAISGTFNYGGGPSSFSCPADIQSMKGGADVTTVANIVKGVDTMDYTVVWSQAWGGPISIGVNAGGFQVYKNAPVGQLYFYGINADGSTEFLKSMTFIYSIKG